MFLGTHGLKTDGMITQYVTAKKSDQAQNESGQDELFTKDNRGKKST